MRERGRPDLSVVDELARLQLAARRLGCSIQLRHPSGPLGDLLALAGLAEVIAGSEGPERSVVEVGREAEEDEEVGIQKAVEPGDPVA